ncbi:MAG TPA: DUF5915 domain-containing protein, partial [Actinomycetes bacterium]|nr:DUF5915 domain-containing protein [Actinomycetes bacterium]
YTLMTVGTLVFDQSAYKNVLCLGHILDKDGRKMSKHLGNVIEPMELMERHGADAVRWFMLAAGSPWAARRLSHESVQEVVRKTLLTYWNTVSFHTLYARLAEWSPDTAAPPALQDRPLLDRWLASQTHQLVRDVDSALESFDTQAAGRAIADFVDQLSNWYVRRSRRRFWDGDPAALATLHEALERLTLVMAPLTPFITERVWHDLVVPTTPTAAVSVHLADWPATDGSLLDGVLGAQVAQVRRLVELGRAARAESGVKTRQPLARALVAAPGWQSVPEELRGLLADELNVQVVDQLGDEGDDLVQVTAKANFRSLGKRFGQRTPEVAAAIAAADPTILRHSLQTTGHAEVALSDELVELQPEDVVLTETPRAGWAVQQDNGESIALDLEITPPLRRLGVARDVVRHVQEARKSAGLSVADRIHLTWQAGDDVAMALQEHQDLIANEVLARSISPAEGPPSPDCFQSQDDGLGLLVWIQRV